MYLMEIHTGVVAPEEKWLADFQSMSSEEWGGNTFESAGLMAVVPNVKGADDYDENYGEWRPLND